MMCWQPVRTATAESGRDKGACVYRAPANGKSSITHREAHELCLHIFATWRTWSWTFSKSQEVHCN